jgi:hypothetical protein
MGDSGEDAEAASQDPSEGSNETDTNETKPAEGAGPAITTTWKNASGEGASGPGFYNCNPPVTLVEECDNPATFTVGANATAVVAELAWEGDTDVYYTAGRVLLKLSRRPERGKVVEPEEGNPPAGVRRRDDEIARLRTFPRLSLHFAHGRGNVRETEGERCPRSPSDRRLGARSPSSGDGAMFVVVVRASVVAFGLEMPFGHSFASAPRFHRSRATRA